MAKKQPIAERFWSKVDRSGGPDACHEWKAGQTNGYGTFRIGSPRRAHRVAWELTNGPVPDGLCICHACDRPLCCNASHLWLGTRLDNNADRVAKGRNGGASGERNGAFTHPEGIRRGERNGISKLTEENVIEIRAAAAAGESQRTIAKRYGVTHTLIGYVVRRQFWKHVL